MSNHLKLNSNIETCPLFYHWKFYSNFITHTHAHAHTFYCPLDFVWVKPMRILLKQDTLSGSVISWAICKSAPRLIQITTLASLPDAVPATHPTA